MSAKLSFKDEYELELAIDAISEHGVVSKLSSIFGSDIANEISLINLTKRGDLFFFRYRFAINKLSDDNYEKLIKDNKVLIISDELSLERSAKLLEYCLPVEIQLKKLLTYVYPSIIAAFDGKTDKKSRIKLCKQINSWNLGDLLERLEFDIASKKREDLFLKDGNALADTLDKAKSFDDFKKTLIPQIRQNTVWDQICVVLEKPVKYSDIKNSLHTLRFLRNKAAHPQPILDFDLNTAKKCSDSIIEKISDVKDDYRNELSKSIQSIEKALSDAAQMYTPEIQKIMDGYLKTMPDMSKNIQKIAESIKAPDPTLAMKKINWLAIDSEMRKTDPEFGEIMNRFNNNDTKTVLNEMKDELNELQSNKQEDDDSRSR